MRSLKAQVSLLRTSYSSSPRGTTVRDCASNSPLIFPFPPPDELVHHYFFSFFIVIFFSVLVTPAAWSGKLLAGRSARVQKVLGLGTESVNGLC